MAERKKTTKPPSKSSATKTADGSKTQAKREAESKEAAKPTRAAGSKEAAKTETRSASQAKAKTAKPKAAPKKRTAAKAKGADARSAESKGPGAKSKPAAKPKSTAKPKTAAKKEAPERPVVRARARYVRVAPRKARLIADQVRGLPLEDARTLLRFSARGPARDIAKLIDSAASNAENNHDLVADDLLVSDIHVDEGPTLRRYRPRALGRATRINKRTSHIAVALTPED
jgi:ribosomal protein L22